MSAYVTPITSRPGNSGFKLVEIIPAAPVVPQPAPAPAVSAKVIEATKAAPPKVARIA